MSHDFASDVARHRAQLKATRHQEGKPSGHSDHFIACLLRLKSAKNALDHVCPLLLRRARVWKESRSILHEVLRSPIVVIVAGLVFGVAQVHGGSIRFNTKRTSDQAQSIAYATQTQIATRSNTACLCTAFKARPSNAEDPPRSGQFGSRSTASFLIRGITFSIIIIIIIGRCCTLPITPEAHVFERCAPRWQSSGLKWFCEGGWGRTYMSVCRRGAGTSRKLRHTWQNGARSTGCRSRLKGMLSL